MLLVPAPYLSHTICARDGYVATALSTPSISAAVFTRFMRTALHTIVLDTAAHVSMQSSPSVPMNQPKSGCAFTPAGIIAARHSTHSILPSTPVGTPPPRATPRHPTSQPPQRWLAAAEPLRS